MVAIEPVFLALLASACFGLALVITQFGLRHLQAAAGAVVSIPTTAVLFWAVSPFLLDLDGWQTQAAGIFALVGLFFPAIVTLLTFEANRSMGPTVTGAVGSTAPLFAVAAAILLLGESVTIRGALATIFIVVGIAMLTLQPKDSPNRWPRRLLVLPLTAAALRGLAQAAAKLGLALWPSPFAAGLIGYTVSAASIAAAARIRLASRGLALNTKGTLWFAAVGLCNGAAVLSMYAALKLGSVTTVAPVVATYPLFSLLFGAFWLPQERPTPRMVIGVALTIAGVAALLVR
jgi:drug/metabolite transporter (DMT)-like permease